MVVTHPQHPEYYTFENLTVAPYNRELIDMNLLSPADVKYINAFHTKCIDLLSPLL